MQQLFGPISSNQQAINFFPYIILKVHMLKQKICNISWRQKTYRKDIYIKTS